MQCFIVYRVKAFFKKCAAKKGTRPNDAASEETANCEIDLRDRTGKQIFCVLKEMKWDLEFISNKLTKRHLLPWTELIAQFQNETRIWFECMWALFESGL